MTDELSLIGRRAILGSGARVFEFAGTRLVAFVGGAILARILIPDMFGWFAMSNLALTFGAMFPDLVAAGIVQSKTQPTRAELRCLFAFQILVAATVAAAVAAAAPSIVRWYNRPWKVAGYNLPGECVWLIVALAANFLVQSLRTIPVQLLAREIQFTRLAAIGLAGVVVHQAVAIAAAVAGWGVWSFVAGAGAKTVCDVTLTYWMRPWRPGFSLRFREAARFLSYGSKMLAVQIILFIKDNVSPLLIGILDGASAVAYINLAWQYTMISVSIVNVTSSVIFPVTSRLQGHPKELKKFAAAVLHGFSVLGIPLAVASIGLAGPLVKLIYTARWEPAVPAIQYLLFHTLGALFTGPLIAMLYGLGRMKETVRIVLSWTAATWIAVAVLRPEFGYLGASMGYSLGIVLPVVWLVRLIGRTLEMDIVQLLLGPLLGALAMGVILWRLRPGESVGQIVLALVLAGIAYAVTVWVTDRGRLLSEYRTVRKLLREK